MIEFIPWMKSYGKRNRPFLILGKGPSFSLFEDFDVSDYNLVALNHVVREVKVEFAHIIDIDVIEACADCLYDNARYLVVPQVPHVDCKPTSLTLANFVDTIPVLRQFSDEGRLLSYPLWSGPDVSGIEKVAGTFSGSVVVNLLAQARVGHIRTLGVDGGISYSERFSDLSDTTLFKNQHKSFDVQSQEIRKVVEQSGIDFKPLVEPVRVFIGGDRYQTIAAKVLEYSIQRHTRHPLQIFHMTDLELPTPKNPDNAPGTGFSFYRFVIPKLCGFKGKAIYLDADMLVFDDIANLWNLPFGGKDVLCSYQEEIPPGWENGQNNSLGEDRHWSPGRQLSVMLLNCENLDWDIDEIIAGLDAGRYSYRELMADLCSVESSRIADTIPNEWNCLEWFEPARSSLVHFTVVPTQPWRHENNRLNDLWESALVDAVQAGAVRKEEVAELVAAGLLKPSLTGLLEPIEAVTGEQAPVVSVTEEERLRHFLWESMNEANQLRKEVNRVRTFPMFWLEELLVRTPARFGLRVLRWLRRKVGMK